MNLPVHLDLDTGKLAIGSHSFAVSAAGPHGEIRLGGDSGTLLRPLTFGERTSIVGRAASEPSPLQAVASGILLTSVIANLSVPDPLMLEIAALVLAGAEKETLAFDEASRIAQLRTGMDPEDVERLPAREVDSLAHAADVVDPAPGWNRIVFAPQLEWTHEEIRNDLAGRLLSRGAAVTSPTDFHVEDRESGNPLESEIRTPADQTADEPTHSGHLVRARFDKTSVRCSTSDSRVPAGSSVAIPPANTSAVEEALPEPATMGSKPNRPLDFPITGPGRYSSWPVEVPQFHASSVQEETISELRGFSYSGTSTTEQAHQTAVWHPAARHESLRTRMAWSVVPLSGVSRHTAVTFQQAALPDDMADALALLLNEEADLRGID